MIRRNEKKTENCQKIGQFPETVGHEKVDNFSKKPRKNNRNH